MKNKNIIILDDHSLFLKGMTLILKECCINFDISPYQSIKKLKSDKINFDSVDLLISDIEMPEEDTFELFAILKDKHPNLPILVVSMHKKNAVIRKCKTLGIEGYLLKDEDELLNKAIETILDGKEYYSKSIKEFYKASKTTFEKISAREEEIIKLIAAGYNNVEVAEKLNISTETIKTHKRNIRTKLDIYDNSEITEYAKQNFLL